MSVNKYENVPVTNDALFKDLSPEHIVGTATVVLERNEKVAEIYISLAAGSALYNALVDGGLESIGLTALFDMEKRRDEST